MRHINSLLLTYFTSCIQRSLVSRDSIVDGDWLPATEWCQRYMPCFNERRTSQKIWGGFLYGVYRPREWLWIDSNSRNGNLKSSQWRSQRGALRGSSAPWKNVKNFPEVKIVEKTQRWCLHVLHRHQTTSFAQTKVTHFFKAVVWARDNANTTPCNHPHSNDRAGPTDIPEHGFRESRRESRIGGEALHSLSSEISHSCMRGSGFD